MVRFPCSFPVWQHISYLLIQAASCTCRGINAVLMLSALVAPEFLFAGRYSFQMSVDRELASWCYGSRDAQRKCWDSLCPRLAFSQQGGSRLLS